MVLLLPGDTGGIVELLERCFAFDGQRSMRTCRDSSGGRRERISNGNCYVLACMALSIRRIKYEPIPVMGLISMKHASSSISSPSSPSNGSSSE